MDRTMMSDERLIQRFQDGDKDSLDALIKKHEARAYQYAFRLTRNPDEAADVVAEAFVRVYKAAHNFRGQSAFSTWLYRILTNCFLDMRKKDRSKYTTSLDAAIETSDGDLERQIEATDTSPHIEVERNEQAKTLLDAIDQLCEYQKSIIMMYHADMMTYEEIAETLNLPIGTVKSRLNRARLALREILSPEQELLLSGS